MWYLCFVKIIVFYTVYSSSQCNVQLNFIVQVSVSQVSNTKIRSQFTCVSLLEWFDFLTKTQTSCPPLIEFGTSPPSNSLPTPSGQGKKTWVKQIKLSFFSIISNYFSRNLLSRSFLVFLPQFNFKTSKHRTTLSVCTIVVLYILFLSITHIKVKQARYDDVYLESSSKQNKKRARTHTTYGQKKVCTMPFINLIVQNVSAISAALHKIYSNAHVLAIDQPSK